MRVLVTGGAGYIGSHTLLELLSLDHDVCVVDNFANSSPEVLSRVRSLSNGAFVEHEADIRDQTAMTEIFETFRPNAVIHFAGLKAVGESAEKPVEYYDTNINGTISLVKAMERVDCRKIIFSSSATVYGEPEYLPYDENHRCAPTSVYGRTKHMAELILKDWQTANPQNSVVLLRYFNPVGAHSSGQLGEDPKDIPNNLMPFVAQVAVGRRDKLRVFGNDYQTHDGTGVRDYIHVVDLARAHIAALDYNVPGTEAINVGTGQNYSVLDMVRSFSKASGQNIPYEIVPRRAGDIAAMLSDTTRAQKLLKWSAEHDLDDMCASAWKWQTKNPNGYDQT